MDPRAAHIGIHHDHPLAALDHHPGKVYTDRAFSFLRPRTGDQDRFDRINHTCELDIGSQRPECFRDWRSRVLEDVHPLVYAVLARDGQLCDVPQRRQLENPADLLRGSNRVVQILDQEDNSAGQHQPNRNSQDGVGQHVGAHGHTVRLRRLDQLHHRDRLGFLQAQTLVAAEQVAVCFVRLH